MPALSGLFINRRRRVSLRPMMVSGIDGFRKFKLWPTAPENRRFNGK